VRGAEHFRTSIKKGIEIIEGLRGHTSGLCIPTYVVDAPGGGGKIPIQPQYLMHYDEKKGRAVLRNFQDKIYEYLEPGYLRDEIRPVRSRATPRSAARAAGSAPPTAEGDKVVGKSRWVHKGASPKRPRKV
jgi:lysine 2,3-aminomutase